MAKQVIKQAPAREREASLMIVTGKKGVGKTYLSLTVINKYIQDTPSRKGRKVLIFDANGEYTQFKMLALADVGRFAQQQKIEVRRIMPLNPDGSPMGVNEMVKAMGYVLENYRGGLLVLEDINRYTSGTSGNELVSSITTNRHKSMDIIMHLQSLRRISPIMWQNVNVVRFHAQIDDVAGAKNKIPNYEIVKIAQNLVNARHYAKKDIRFYCYILLEENLIKGAFSKQEFQEAIREYIQAHPAELRRATNMFDNDGKKIERSKAMDFVISEKMKYFGN